jgi:hypothetical protein
MGTAAPFFAATAVAAAAAAAAAVVAKICPRAHLGLLLAAAACLGPLFAAAVCLSPLLAAPMANMVVGVAAAYQTAAAALVEAGLMNAGAAVVN